MPDLREVFQMSTQKVRPDRGFVERQEFRQRRRMRNRKIGAYVIVAAIIIAVAMVAIAVFRNGPTSSVPADVPTPTEGLGPTTLAKGEAVELVGNARLAAQTLDINAEEDNGVVTGEFRISNDDVIRVDCADTHTDGVVILGGAVTGGSDFGVGELVALIIREGDPDSVALRANDTGATSCTGLLKAIPDHLLTDDSNFVEVESGSDIQTG